MSAQSDTTAGASEHHGNDGTLPAAAATAATAATPTAKDETEPTNEDGTITTIGVPNNEDNENKDEKDDNSSVQDNDANQNERNGSDDSGDNDDSDDKEDIVILDDPPASTSNFRGEPQLKRARSNTDLDDTPAPALPDGALEHEDDIGHVNDDNDGSGNDETPQSPIARGYSLQLDSDNASDSDGPPGDDNSTEGIEYPFGECPTSLQDVATFIQSDACNKILILAGAGMSVKSGIPDFRSANGLYATMDVDVLTADEVEKEAIRMDPTIALDKHLFVENQFPCLELNRSFLLGTQRQQWKATLAHRFVELLHARTNKLARLYTQNIDGLEDQCTKLPHDKVVNVHGSMDRADCAMCGAEGDFEQFCEQVKRNIKDISTPKDEDAPLTSTPIACATCGYNTMKPSIVLFRSSLPRRFFELVPQDIDDVDLLIVVGTSLTVAPANTIVFRVPSTAMRVVVNRDPVGRHVGIRYGDDTRRDYFAGGDIDTSMLELMWHLGWVDELKPLLTGDQLPAPSAACLSSFLAEKAAASSTATEATASTATTTSVTTATVC